MDYVSCLVALGGDMGNTVPKSVPVSEIPVLQALHGEASVFDVAQIDRPANVEDLDNREELQRLVSIYGHAQDEDGSSIVMQVYPGRGAKVVTSIEDLGLEDEAFATTARATPKAARAAAKAEKKPASTKAAKPPAEPVITPAGGDEGDDGNGVMD